MGPAAESGFQASEGKSGKAGPVGEDTDRWSIAWQTSPKTLNCTAYKLVEQDAVRLWREHLPGFCITPTSSQTEQEKFVDKVAVSRLIKSFT